MKTVLIGSLQTTSILVVLSQLDFTVKSGRHGYFLATKKETQVATMKSLSQTKQQLSVRTGFELGL
jgi:hypothetical protein